MESGIISQQNTVYVLNTSYKYGNTDMMNLLLTPAAIKAVHDNYSLTETAGALQSQIPQATDSKETFNDMTRKSLLKINLFIKRLKWLNIFADSDSSSNGQNSKDINRKCNKFLNTKKALSSKEMYREAAKLLGIDCSLSSSCRCFECQSHYFDYSDSTEQIDEDDESESEDEDSDEESDTDSISSEFNDPDHYITNCYLIHTEELCECCQMQNDRRHPPSSSFSDNACNDLSFNTFLS